MPIRYCTATSKRAKKPCRARAMRGRDVCYHHGGKSRRGVDHPRFEHGYYSVEPLIQLMWMLAQDGYQGAMREARTAEFIKQLKATNTTKDFKRVRAAFRAARVQWPDDRITPDMAHEIFEQMKEAWPGLFENPHKSDFTD